MYYIATVAADGFHETIKAIKKIGEVWCDAD